MGEIFRFLWPAPWTLVGLLIGGVGYVFGARAQFVGDIVEFHGGLISWMLKWAPIQGGASAMTIGHVVLGRSREDLERARHHEVIHVRQYERWGVFFVPAYLGASLWLWLQGKDAYLDNPFERAARKEGRVKTIAELKVSLPSHGRVEWIGVSPQRRGAIQPVNSALLVKGLGIEGDHHAKSGRSARQVTIIQAEHLPVVAALLGRAEISATTTRRNVVVAGLNILALKDRRFRIGEAVLEGTGLCVPCSRMEEEFGQGGYNAMRGHGGITTRVLEGGVIQIGDVVEPLEDAATPSSSLS